MQTKLLTLIGLMAVVTYVTRAGHLLIPQDKIPTWIREHLDLIPVVIMSSIVSTSIFIHNNSCKLEYSATYIVAAVITVLTYVFLRRGGVAVMVGLGFHIGLKMFF
ncbi:AzlD domain-containing protein [Geobacter sp. SVR]|uniref:AzlD domain-containing protein n=1 Tax=Geobacter sp. SVR TaxID=2495594 RepID=UPI00143EF99C|nr:AzlD domain-containing protein [Geobacter sp. SVR]BCS54411.1 hypothetical protein GSVR_27190 [Geobacter sp. SVR]GCF87642.1 hypothetical protein GSbR_42420 [Geobacter sp. SVR]